jgi:predicted transcriptional regulator
VTSSKLQRFFVHDWQRLHDGASLNSSQRHRRVIMTAQLLEFSTPAKRDWHDAPNGATSEFGRGAVSMWMRPLAGRCTKDTPLRDAVELMVSSDVDHLVVTDEDGHLAGLVSYRSLVALIARGTYRGPAHVGGLVEGEPMTTSPEVPFATALKLLDPPDVTCVVIVENRRPLGVISEAHLARPTLDLVAASL